MENTAAYVYTSLAFPQKDKKNTITIYFSKPTAGCISKEIEIRISQRYLHVHCSIIHNSQDMEAISVSTDGWRDTENMVFVCNAILFNLKKEGNLVIFDDIDEPGGPDAEWNKPHAEE